MRNPAAAAVRERSAAHSSGSYSATTRGAVVSGVDAYAVVFSWTSAIAVISGRPMYWWSSTDTLLA